MSRAVSSDRELFVDLDPARPRRRAEQQDVHVVEPRELGYRLWMVVGAKVDEDVGQARVAAVPLDDEDRRGLLSPAVASCRLGRGEALEEPLGEGPPRSGAERRGERGDRLLTDEDVPLRRETRSRLSRPPSPCTRGP